MRIQNHFLNNIRPILLFFFIFAILISLLLTININALDSNINTGFSLSELSEEDEKNFRENTDIALFSDEPAKSPIVCFDVSETEKIALGHSSGSHKTIDVYTTSGEFCYGYRFECSGNFGIEWDKDALIIYFVRSNVALSVNTAGEIENILEIQNNTIENNSYWNNNVFSNKRNVGNTEYSLKNDMGVFNIFASSYSQLVAAENGSKEITLYDVNTSQLIAAILKLITVVIFTLLVLFIVIRQFFKLKRSV